MFRGHFQNFEVFETKDKENQKSQGKIESEFGCVISGLKCFLTETAVDLVDNLSEDFFNVNAEPFRPKKISSADKNSGGPLDHLKYLASTEKSSSVAPDAPDSEKAEQQQLEKKR